MARSLTRQEAKSLLEHAQGSFPHDACLTCECFLGYAAQIAIDAGVDLGSLLAEMGIDRKRTHSCLGCEPCPPADLFANYQQVPVQRSRARDAK
jgi:hypothetical protein